MKEGQLKVWYYQQDDDIDIEYGGEQCHKKLVSSVDEAIALGKEYNKTDIITTFGLYVYRDGNWHPWENEKGEDLQDIVFRQEDESNEISQCQAIGEARYKTWEEYRQGCLSTFAAGYSGKELDAFRHGMNTVFNLLQNEFPEPYQIWKQEE